MNTDLKKTGIQSVSRAILILRCFLDNKELGLTEISKMVGLHKSTTAGIVNTLKSERFLDQNADTGKYRLGIDLFCLAASAKLELSDICEPFLIFLLKEFGETVNLGILDEDQVVYIAKKESTHSMRISTYVGKRIPLHCTAIGKAILAHLPQNEAAACIDRLDMRPFTDKTITDKTVLWKALDEIRSQGIAYDCEELEHGLVCMAVPIFKKPGGVIGALSISGPSIRMDDALQEKIRKALQQISSDISTEISRF